MTTVTRAVIPAAGRGTRLLPATKAIPKELLPVVDRPAIQHVVEEAVAAGAEEIVIVTGPHKDALADQFATSSSLERWLEASGRHDELAVLRRLASIAEVRYVLQPEPLGLGHAVLQAESIVGTEPFLVLLPDSLMRHGPAVMGALVAIHERHGGSVVALRDVEPAEVGRYGCTAVEALESGVVRVRDLVEKPALGEAPSSFVIMARYLFTPEIFDHLRNLGVGADGEIQLTDAMAELARSSSLLGSTDTGGVHDVGSVRGLLQAQVELGVAHPEHGPSFRRFLREFVDAGLDDSHDSDSSDDPECTA